MKLLITRELAEIAGLHDWQIWRLIKAKRLKPVQLANHHYVWPPEEVEKAKAIAISLKAKGRRSDGHSSMDLSSTTTQSS